MCWNLDGVIFICDVKIDMQCSCGITTNINAFSILGIRQQLIIKTRVRYCKYLQSMQVIVLMQECHQHTTVHATVCDWRNYTMFRMKALTGHFRGTMSRQLIFILPTAGCFPLHSVCLNQLTCFGFDCWFLCVLMYLNDVVDKLYSESTACYCRCYSQISWKNI